MINKKLPLGVSPAFRLSSANESVGSNGEKDDIAYPVVPVTTSSHEKDGKIHILHECGGASV